MKNFKDLLQAKLNESLDRFDADQVIRDYLDKKNKENHAGIDEDTLSDITMEISELWDDEDELRNIKSEKQLIKKLEQTLPYLHDENETDTCYCQTIKGLKQEQFDKLIGKKYMKSITEHLKQHLLTESKKYEFSDKELDELFKFFKEDDDFKDTYKKAKNPRYNDFEDSLKDFRTFLDTDVYADGAKDVHKFYILDTEDLGCSWMKLTTGKIANLDNLWVEYKSIVNDK